jgi:predicted DNA-binding transcriptional regulator YafY
MDRTERFYKIDQLLNEFAVVPTGTFLKELGVSLATFKRDLTYMCDRLHAPIAFDKRNGGYKYIQADKSAPTFALPGLWFNASEAHALLAMQQLLSKLEPGLLAGHIAPLQARLTALLETNDHAAEEVAKRIKIVHSAKRNISPESFSKVANATLKRKRLHVVHFNRGTGEELERSLSPQCLVHYRDNWYLIAYCHLRNSLRSFSVDAFRKVAILDDASEEIDSSEIDALIDSGYGIFGGKAVEWATLKFTPERAKWVSMEMWHPEQRSRFEADDSYILEVPFSNYPELLMDILKHGPGVEVLEPLNLREIVIETLAKTLANYEC